MRRRNRDARPGLTRTGVGEVGGFFLPYTEDRGGPNPAGGYGAWVRTYWGLGYPTLERARAAVRCRDRGEPAPDGGVFVDRATGTRLDTGGTPDDRKGGTVPWDVPVNMTPVEDLLRFRDEVRRNSLGLREAYRNGTEWVDGPGKERQGGPADG